MLTIQRRTLAVLRELAGLKQRDLAELTGLSSNAISQAERGYLPNSSKTLERIATALGYTGDPANLLEYTSLAPEWPIAQALVDAVLSTDFRGQLAARNDGQLQFAYAANDNAAPEASHG